MYINLYIEKGTPIKEIARQFNLYYPYLKIEFYKKPNAEEHSSSKEVTESTFPSSPLTQFTQQFTINISSNRTIKELEKDCASLGLRGQIYRKSGNVWIKTSFTNDWTLQHQNYEGEQISQLLIKKKKQSPFINFDI